MSDRRELPPWMPREKRLTIWDFSARWERTPPDCRRVWEDMVRLAATMERDAAKAGRSVTPGVVPLAIAAQMATPAQLDVLLREQLIAPPSRAGYPIVDWDAAEAERAEATRKALAR